MRPNPILLITLLAVALAAPAASRGPAAPTGDGPWVLRVYGWADGQLREVGARFDHVAVFPAKRMLLVHADEREELAFLRRLGLRLEVDDERTATLRKIAAYRARGVESLAGIPGFECYRTVEETLATGAQIAAEHPGLATWIDAGDSWEKIHLPPAGFDLRVLRLTNAAVPGDKPALFVTGAIHAREYTTAELVTRFAETLVAGHDVDPDVTWILDHHEVHLLLVTNPDGRKRAEAGLSWRKNADNDFCTDTDDRGIDLNRNFDFEWACCGGSSPSECSPTFHGPFAASEPETGAVQDHMTLVFPDQRPDDLTTPAPPDSEGIYLDLHSFGQIVLSSWGFTVDPPPNADGILTLARKVAFFPGYAAQLGSLGIVDGSTKDYAYGRLGVPGYTVELGTAFFEECAPFESTILPGNLDALTHAAKNVRTPYVTPSGPDTVDPAAAALPIVAGDPVAVTATVDDTRYSGAEPSQPIAAAEVWVDTPPWQAGTPLPMTASDGAFDQTVEAVEVTLDTSGLAPGRHTLFVRGADAGGTFGAVSAAFLFVIDPVSSPTLQGTLTDAADGSPLAGTVTIGPFSVSSDPGTGAYSLQVPSGTYDVSAGAPGYVTATVDDVALADFQALTLDFALAPLVEIFADSVEGGNAGWTAEPGWAITDEAANSPTRSWTDSPGTDYPDNADASLTSPVFDLSDFQGTALAFWHIFDFETGFDAGLVEVSTDGAAWTALRSFSQEGQDLEWRREEIALPMLDGAAAARFRFRISTDGSVTRDGWHIDDVLLEAASTGLIFADGFESGDTSSWSGSVP